MTSILYRNCQCYDFESGQTYKDVLVHKQHIVQIEQQINTNEHYESHDGSALWLLPKYVDLCQRPFTKEVQGFSLHHEIQAASHLGFDTICIPPDTPYITDNTRSVEQLLSSSTEQINIAAIGALTTGLEGTHLTDMSSLQAAGCFALSQALHNIKDTRFLRRAYQYAASFNIPIFIQPHDPWLTGSAHEGFYASSCGLEGIPDISESIAISLHCELIHDTGVAAHFTCISSAKGVNAIANAKQQGLDITCDTAMHHVLLNDSVLSSFDSNYFVLPPLRSNADQQALIEGLQNGTIDAICSAHHPLDKMAKEHPFADSYPGISSIETFLASGIELIQKDIISPLKWAQLTSSNPLKCMRKTNRNTGFCLVNPEQAHQMSLEQKSLGVNNPLKARPQMGLLLAVT